VSSIPRPELSSLYQEIILEHYKRPRNRGEMEDGTVEVHMRNPSCGDEIRLHLRLDGDVISDVKFVGEGCSISQAATSMMTTLVKGSRLDDALGLARRFTEMMHGDPGAAADRNLRDLRALQGVSKFPVRVKCALLGFDALQEAVRQSRGADESAETRNDGP
jgi:nitrogen fixation NifU-like protein